MKHILITALLAALSASAAFAQAGADDALATLTTAVKAKEYQPALELAKTLVEKDAAREGLAGILFEAGSAALSEKQLAYAAGFYRLLVDQFPKSEHASAARGELVACYTFLRQLDACIAQAKTNLELEPESEWAEYWHFLIAQSYFRLWDYPQAKTQLEAFLVKYPNGKYAANAQSNLERINPPWKIDEHGFVSYSGKYDGDIRLQAAVKTLPAEVDEGFRILEERLGLDLKPRANVLYEFKDPEAGSKGGMVASTMVIGMKDQPTNLIRFFSEYVVAQPTHYRKTLVHELKHAGFQGIIGHPYDDLPVWVREGLAVWGSDDVATRVQLVLCNQIIGGKDPLTVLDGIEDPAREEADYMEDALAFEWLESKKPGNVKAFCARLVKGESYREIWADLSGMSYAAAIVAANTHCRNRVTTALGDAYTAFKQLHKAHETAINAGKPANEKWLNEGGQAAFEKWLTDHPDHACAPFARFSLARSFLTAGQFAAGRKLLQQILDEDSLRSTLLDDAQLWIGVSYNWEQDSANAAAAFGVLLRDFSCSQSAKQVAGKFPAAGPVTR